MRAVEPSEAASNAATEGSAATPPDLTALAVFVGTWRGSGTGEYPTIASFGYTEEIELQAVPGKPFLSYRSATRHCDDERRLHAESGWLRLVGPAAVELVVAQGPGIVEVTEGQIVVDGDMTELRLASTVVAGSTTSVEVSATRRHYRVVGDELAYDLAMATTGRPLTHHLRATLQRVR
ncbi:MAG: protein of uncharacterized function [Acidimicrobiales bacterium]|nr:protein of uncharacterized function [Acidimicrobiales bacterium]